MLPEMWIKSELLENLAILRNLADFMKSRKNKSFCMGNLLSELSVFHRLSYIRDPVGE